MHTETKNCQNCKQDFTIEQDDFSFYEKMHVPLPTFCPECRMIRRLVWRNERSLHKRQCGLCGKSLISMYSDQAPVYCAECWGGTGWDQFAHARDVDLGKNFLLQLHELFKINPRFYAYKFGNFVNSEYVNYAKDDKNCHLSFSVIDCEDVHYSYLIDASKSSFDCLNAIKLDQCYQNINCEANYNTFFAFNSQNCLNCLFVYDCVNSSDCFMSSNLRNQQYVFRNQKLTKEKYFEELGKINVEKYTILQALEIEFKTLIRYQAIHKYSFSYASENSSGDYIHHVKNAKKCFDVYDSENISYAFRVLHAKDSMDNSGCGYGDLIYESMAATMNTFRDAFCYITIQGSRECEYSFILKNCSNCFGCAGLTNAEYCILNKQYEKNEYFSLVEKIKKNMDELPYIDAKGRIYKYGEFFPFEMSPFGYNETNAQDFFTIEKEEALQKGYSWKDREKREYAVTQESTDLSDSILEVTDSIVGEIIGCPNIGNPKYQCTSAFKITQDELSFYRQKKLPLPRYCPNCRHYERLSYRNPLRLYSRTCMCDLGRASADSARPDPVGSHNHNGKCPNEFETSYSPDRSEKVYCESCYQKEVL